MNTTFFVSLSHFFYNPFPRYEPDLLDALDTLGIFSLLCTQVLSILYVRLYLLRLCSPPPPPPPPLRARALLVYVLTSSTPLLHLALLRDGGAIGD